jgi:hypothetical protein
MPTTGMFWIRQARAFFADMPDASCSFSARQLHDQGAGFSLLAALLIVIAWKI